MNKGCFIDTITLTSVSRFQLYGFKKAWRYPPTKGIHLIFIKVGSLVKTARGMGNLSNKFNLKRRKTTRLKLYLMEKCPKSIGNRDMSSLTLDKAWLHFCGLDVGSVLCVWSHAFEMDSFLEPFLSQMSWMTAYQIFTVSDGLASGSTDSSLIYQTRS